MILIVIVLAVLAVAAATAVALFAYRVLKAAHSRPSAHTAASGGHPHAHPATTGRGPLERAVLGTVTGVIRLLLRLGIAPGPMRMLGVRGRVTGITRMNPVDVYDGGDRSILVATHDANASWVRNLRTAGEGTLARGRRRWTFTAVELSPEDSAEVLREVLGPRLTRPLAGLALRQTMNLAPGAGPADFIRAAASHPVFALAVAPVPGTSARRRSGPVTAIAAGLAVTAAHAVLGAVGVMTAPEWISGAIIGLVIAGAGNHTRIFGRTGH
jgi:deazaflavin-dependent oxidoreductase (nitroreductase family)